MRENPCDAVKAPRSRLDKLGVRPGSAVWLVGLDEPGLIDELSARTPHLVSSGTAAAGRRRRDLELVLFRVHSLPDLDRLDRLRLSIRADGAIWVIWTKGQKALNEDHVRRAALAQGLVDVKVMAFSAELSGLKLVVPVARRAAHPAGAR